MWALGAILYEMLTLRQPFAAGERGAARRAGGEDPSRPRRLDRRIPPDLEAVCLKCLEREPERRYPSALELAEDLERVRLLRPVRARRITAVGLAGRSLRRNTRSATLGAAVFVLAALLLVQHGRWQESEARHRAADAVKAYLVLRSMADPSAAAHREGALAALPDPSVLPAFERLMLPGALEAVDRLFRGEGRRPAPAIVVAGRPATFLIEGRGDPRIVHALEISEAGLPVIATWTHSEPGAAGLFPATAPEALPEVPRPRRLAWSVEARGPGGVAAGLEHHGSFVAIPAAAEAALLDLGGALGTTPEEALVAAEALVLLGRGAEALACLDRDPSIADPRLAVQGARVRRIAQGLAEGATWASRAVEICWLDGG